MSALVSFDYRAYARHHHHHIFDFALVCKKITTNSNL